MNLTSIKSFIVRFITSAIILSLTAFFTPNFEIKTLTSLLIAALSINVVNLLLSLVLRKRIPVVSKGIINFIVSIILLYTTQFFITNYYISFPSAILGAIIYSIIASYVPTQKDEKKASQDSTTS